MASRSRRPPVALLLVGLATGLVFLGPFAYVVSRNVDLGTDFGSIIWSRDTWDPLRRSLWLGTTVAFSAAVVGTGLAWLTFRTDIPGRRVWRILAPLPLVIPSFVGASALIAAFATGGLAEEILSPIGITDLPDMRGFRGAWLVLTLFTYPYVYLPVAARMSSLSPSLEESARLLGRSPWTVFRTVVLPQSAGAIWAGALLVFLYTISDWGAVERMGYSTLTRDIYSDRVFDQARSMGLSLVLGVVALTVVMAERSLDRRRQRVEAVRTRDPMIVPLGRWKWPAMLAGGAVLANALLGPMAVFGFWSWRGLSADNPSPGLRTDVGDLVSPALNTAQTGLITAAVAIAVVLPVAWLTARYRSRVGGAANGMVVAGFALPGVVIALSLVFWVLQSPILGSWYQTLPLMIVAYVLHFGAQATRAAHVAVGAVPDRLGDAAATLGAGRVRRFLTVELPLMTPGLLAGAGLVMLSTMKELPATRLLSPPGFETLATEIWSAGERLNLAQESLAALVLIALSAVLTWAVVLRRSDVY
ncbi:MAG: iron ABC transporter permease [Acidimicrobiales bacterium]|nr:iron ABC transporter permease [Acidimicrobiales bacterium]